MSSNYNRKDTYYHKAKEAGFRSRAAYKIIELDKYFKLLKEGAFVVDLGAWPGGWLQVASKAVGERGIVVGIDLVAVDPLPSKNVQLITGDLNSDEVRAQLLALLPAQSKYDVVLSDMSPKLCGIKEVDRYAEVACAELALSIAKDVLKPGGNLVMKVFKHDKTEAFYKTCNPFFTKVVRKELDATRTSSNEFYIVGMGLKG